MSDKSSEAQELEVISVGEREYLKHLHSMQDSMDAQTVAMERIARSLELIFSRVCLEIDEAKANDGN